MHSTLKNVNPYLIHLKEIRERPFDIRCYCNFSIHLHNITKLDGNVDLVCVNDSIGNSDTTFEHSNIKVSVLWLYIVDAYFSYFQLIVVLCWTLVKKEIKSIRIVRIFKFLFIEVIVTHIVFYIAS